MDAQYSKKCRSINHFQVQICAMAKMHAFIEGTQRKHYQDVISEPCAHTRPVEPVGGVAAWGRFIRVLAPEGWP